MAAAGGNPNESITALLAALAAQSQQNPTPQPAPPGQQPYGAVPQPGLPTPYANYGQPQPTNAGSLDLSGIRPVNSGSVSISDAIAKARGIAAEKGIQYDQGRTSSSGYRDDPRLPGRPYQAPRSRSRSPPRRDQYRENYNPYRDERREDPRRGGYGRDRSRSPRGRDAFSPGRYGNTRDRTPPQDGGNSETILINSSLVGLVIGRQGENLRRVEQESGTRIQFLTGPESSGPQRQCKISGPARARAEAKMEINRIIDENGGPPVKDVARGGRQGKPSTGMDSPTNQPPLREGENSIQIMVPDRTVGLIIGRGGETIRDLQERSGCHINIVGENKSVNGLRPVNLIGTKQASDVAKDLILTIVESDTKSQPGASAAAPPRDALRGGQDMYGGGGGGGGGNEKINDNIMVPSEAVGMIIGKGGETIKEMQNTTGCKINVSQASGADVERDIELVGSRQAIEAAKGAIWEKVDAVKEKNNMRRSGNRDRDPQSDRYSQPAQQQSYGQYPAQGIQQQMPAAAAAGGEANGADPYAAYGGYQAYLTLWYAAVASQQQAAGQPPGGQAPAPGDQSQRPPGL
ncbi:hypothetical protein K402DRAFT_402213 [Aulographum hederae CBS 113979]|uniref:K Homology domain-containing protein n=1 Tax=Aulographum hederae CBS 113979 TaxID=1176131 RepID=A0A6G1H7R7_9PEZI|nr:hypothetical protein K402DRAFT_402213 [Aulographum hederae CBS 113979]